MVSMQRNLRVFDAQDALILPRPAQKRASRSYGVVVTGLGVRLKVDRIANAEDQPSWQVVFGRRRRLGFPRRWGG